MRYVIYLIIALLILIAVIIVLWIAYNVSTTYQQTLTLTVPFTETYRYIPNLNKEDKFKLDAIKVTITGSIKKDSTVITSKRHIQNIINDNVISQYNGCLLIHETNIFTVEENILKRCPLTKNPTLENLTIIFFNKLAPLMPKIGCQLVSVKLMSEGLKSTYSQYKLNNYKL